MAEEACFTRDGERYLPTAHAIGPWSPDLLQGSCTGALLAKGVEAYAAPLAPSSPGWLVGRLSFDFWRPATRAPIALTGQVLRDGRKAKTLAVGLVAEGVEVARCTAVLLREAAVELPPAARGSDAPPPGPESGRPIPDPARRWSPYFTGVDTRAIEGDLMRPGPAAVWFRHRRPVVAGEADTPLMAAIAAADLGSGIAATVDLRQWSFVNAEMTVHLHRPPAGNWMLNRAAMRLDRRGIGLTTMVLEDEAGPFGTASQSLLVEPRAA